MKEFFEMKKEYIECDCLSELLQIIYDNTEYSNPVENDNTLYISMYRDYIYKSTWRRKLQHIWYIIRHDQPWADQICLSLKEANKLKLFLEKYIEDKKFKIK